MAPSAVVVSDSEEVSSNFTPPFFAPAGAFWPFFGGSEEESELESEDESDSGRGRDFFFAGGGLLELGRSLELAGDELSGESLLEELIFCGKSH
jgi:hypothetical protein